MNVQSAANQTQSKLILATRVLNTPVFGKNGEKLGHVDDISIERVSGNSIYGIMSFGGFLGIGERFHPVPWAMLDYDPGMGGFVISMSEADLKGAPHYNREELVPLGGESHQDVEQAIFDYYGRYGVVTPYW